MSSIYILAVETSCDETSIAIIRSKENSLEVLSNKISSQVKLHAVWGGVVPNLAAREHVKNIVPILEQALTEAKIKLADIDLIATVNGPGLIPALMVGVNFAKTLAYLTEKPLIGIHHIEGHIYANFITDSKLPASTHGDDRSSTRGGQNSSESTKNIFSDEPIRSGLSDTKFPILCIVVSGGHTQLVLMKDHLQYEIIGQTLDDAAGEAFDKVARILEIGYPGGPAVAAMADKFENLESKIKLPRPMINSGDFNFSFSGLKTAVLYETKKHPDLLTDKNYITAVCHEFQQASIDVLTAKTIKAARQFHPQTILLAGGVSANAELRKQLGLAIQEFIPNTLYKMPDTALTGDNAAMIGAAAHFRWQKMTAEEKEMAKKNWKTLQANANLKLH